jgi:ABC-2 type transport system permease protein
MKNHFFSDMNVMMGRSMRHITRSMDTIITVCLTPIAMMLLFVYVLGGAIQTGTDNYVNYLLPGILLMAIASGIACLRICRAAFSSDSTLCRLRAQARCGGMC